MRFSAVILAGGKSSRMGRDKALLEVDGQPLLARQIRIARESGAGEVFISGRVDSGYSAFGVQVLLDNFQNAGPLAGIETALGKSLSPFLLVLAVDMPGMSAEILRRLAAQCVDGCGAAPRVGEYIEPLAAFYPKTASRLVTELLEISQGRSSGTGILPVRWRSRTQTEPPIRRDLPQDRQDACPTAEMRPIKSPSAKQFAERCVAAGLARFVDLAAADAHCFANWNSPADLPCLK